MKRTLAIVLSGLFAATLIAVAILLAQVIPSLVIVLAIVVLLAVFGIGAGILITTNTRVAWPFDPYAATTDDLLRPPLRVHEDRRVKNGTVDDRGVVQRLSDILEDEAAKRPRGETPAWFIGTSHDRADDTFPDEPKEGGE